MNKQEVFNTVVEHLLTQNAKSQLGDEDICLYRAHDGLQCAVGCLIDDDHYTPSLEGVSVYASGSVQEALLRSGVDVHDIGIRLFDSLQAIHDGKEVGEWPRALINLGESHNLDTSVVLKYSDPDVGG